MIEEDYVSFETAKLLKENGFDEKVVSFYPPGNIQRPTLQMAMKWLREEKGVYIEIPIVGMEWEAPTKWYFGWRCQTKDVIDRLRSQDANYTSYEEAAEEAIKHCLDNLI